MVMNVANDEVSLEGGDDDAQESGFEELFVLKRNPMMGKPQRSTRANLVGVFSGTDYRLRLRLVTRGHSEAMLDAYASLSLL